jgi:hypothetical protein
MAKYEDVVEKFPHLKEALDTARNLQDNARSASGRAIYMQRQAEINALIPRLIELAKDWDEKELRYALVKLEILRDEVLAMENNTKVYEIMLEQVAAGEFNQDDDEG